MKPSQRSKFVTREEALKLLSKHGCSAKVVEHSKSVSSEALTLASKIKAKGNEVNLEFIEVAALLHDIGRSVSHGITHGIDGARIMKDYPEYARVCERHIGGGIDSEEAVKLGLPEKDYIPETLEEKIIAHADNTIAGSKIVGIKETIESYERKLGKNHSATKRVLELNDYINKLIY